MVYKRDYHPIGESRGQILTFHWLRAKIDSVVSPCSKPEGDTRTCVTLFCVALWNDKIVTSLV